MLTLLLLLAARVSTPDVASAPAPGAVSTPSEVGVDPSIAPTAMLERIDAAAVVLDRIRYGAVRTTQEGGHSTREVWRFASEEGGRFRIDYFGDTPRVVVCDGRTLTDYVPARQAARTFTLAKMDEATRNKLLSSVLGKVTVPGVRTGWKASAMTDWRWGESGVRDGRPTRAIVGTDDKGGQLTFVVDPERGLLLSNTLEDQGVFVFATESWDHREVAPGAWLPERIVTTAPGPGGNIQVEIRLNRVTVGDDVPDALFELDLDPSVEVEHHR